ncbi:hypothetical protein [Planococcus versutus]|uniref:Uncharacterized protein n=1 Tax=Planococcus versutus TaxID=1302659 RepID=A0A1B1RZ04_9BACL|nr:hypothetical protein [Planococcus versutus]ANU26154.1 hypothetical protein I858_003800 [Planococcus versutus]
MTSPKKTSANNQSEKIACKYPVYPIGQNFFVDFGSQESIYGNWQVAENDNAPFYMCRRVFESGNVSRRKSADHYRQFFEAEIHYALNKV